MAGEAEETPTLFHLHLSDSTPTEEEEIELSDGTTAKVIWKDVLVEGEYPMSPGASGAVPTPMKIIADGKSDPKTKTMSFSDIEAAHNDGAFKYVTIPTKHRDDVVDNTGYVPRPGLRRKVKNGKKVLQAALGFTEPDIKGKVERGTIPDVSGGFLYNWTNKHTKKTYPCAMKHVALTGIPFMGNLDAFKPVFASDDELGQDGKIESYTFADDLPGGTTTQAQPTAPDTAEIVWDETKGFRYVSQKIESLLRPERPSDSDPDVPYQPRPSYYVRDVSADNTALVEEYFKGTDTRYVIPFTTDSNGDVTISPSTRWVEVKEAFVAASDDKSFDEASVTALRSSLEVALSDLTGDSHSVYRIDEVALDDRVRITNRAKKKSWVTEFVRLSDGTVFIKNPTEWQAVEFSDKASVVQPAKPNKIEFSIDTPQVSFGRVANNDALQRRAAAIEKRRATAARNR